MFKTIYSHRANRTLRGLTPKLAARIVAAIDDLATAPHKRRANVSKLKGRPESRMRLGDWRVIFTADDSAKLVRIALIAARGSAYR